MKKEGTQWTLIESSEGICLKGCALRVKIPKEPFQIQMQHTQESVFRFQNTEKEMEIRIQQDNNEILDFVYEITQGQFEFGSHQEKVLEIQL